MAEEMERFGMFGFSTIVSQPHRVLRGRGPVKFLRSVSARTVLFGGPCLGKLLGDPARGLLVGPCLVESLIENYYNNGNNGTLQTNGRRRQGQHDGQ